MIYINDCALFLFYQLYSRLTLVNYGSSLDNSLLDFYKATSSFGFWGTQEKNKLLIILLRKSMLSRHIIHHSYSKNIKVYWFKKDLNIYIWSLTKAKINQALSKRQLYYTKNENFKWRLEPTSVICTKSGRVMVDTLVAFNYSAFLSRRSKDFYNIAHLVIKKLIIYSIYHLDQISNSSHSEPSWHYWNMK